MSPIFITGTGTDVGKTYVTTSLLRLIRQYGIQPKAIKPVVSGFDPAAASTSDPGRILEALGQAPTIAAIAAISPFRFSAPLAPDEAARLEGKLLLTNDIFEFCSQNVQNSQGPLLIEGVGGVMSPIAESATVLDLMVSLEISALIVCGTYLGSISHSLTALEAMRTRGVRCAGFIINESPDNSVGAERTFESLVRFSGVPVLATVLRNAAPARLEAAARALGLLPPK